MTEPTGGEFPADPATGPVTDPTLAFEEPSFDDRSVEILGTYNDGFLTAEQLTEIADNALHWCANIHMQGATMPVMREIMTNLVDLERRRCPGAQVWDHVRGMLAETLYAVSKIDTAALVIHGMRSPQVMVQTVVQIEGGQEERPMVLAEALMRLASEDERPAQRSRSRRPCWISS